MIRRSVRIENELGLHARAAARLVKIVSGFQSEVRLGRDGTGQWVDGRSIVSILLLAAGRGSELHIVAEGVDERETADSIVALVADRFGEES
jgi:phosphocarrier protein